MNKTVSAVHPEKNLQALFEPQRVAVVGASRRKEAVGYAILNNLLTGGYRGKIYPVNPKADQIEGVQCYPSIAEIPEEIDLSVIIIPSVAVPAALKESAEKGAKAAIIISAGFREVGAEGRKLEDEVRAIAAQYKISILGPNCLGMINTDSRFSLNASFGKAMPLPGNVAFISQSGALCAAILDYAKGENIGFSKFLSLGNKVDINELDLLRYLKNDKQTDVIMMYLEDLAHGRLFIETVREITGDSAHTKPILAIKSGRTAQGARAAQSHTGSLMGSDSVYDAIFAQAGVLRVDSVGEMFTLVSAFANQPLPKSNRIAIVTNAGGPGIMATDACVRYGLDLVELTSQTKEALKKVLPPTASLANPVDVIGDAQHDRYEAALKSVISDPNVDGVIIIVTPQAMTDSKEIAEVICRINKESTVPILACFMGIVDVSVGVKILEMHKIPHYAFPEDAARALSAMYRYRQWIQRPRTDEKFFEVDKARAKSVLDTAKGRNLSAYEAMEVLEAYGFPVLPFRLAKSETEAVEAAKHIGFPVVLKVVAPEVIHKFDVGGVKLNLTGPEEVGAAYKEMIKNVKKHHPESNIEGVLVQGMAGKGREVILGMNQDPQFGAVLMFGLGGIYVEALKDVTFRLAPIRELGADRMIESIRAYPLLKGIRGEKPADFDAIKDCLLRLSQLVCEHPEIKEVDINPLVVYPKNLGACVVDARILM